jgi:hypothetical protein
MKIKFDGIMLALLLIGMIGMLIPLSVFYANTLTSKPEEEGGGNTTIIVYIKCPLVLVVKCQLLCSDTFWMLSIEFIQNPSRCNQFQK